MQGDVIESQPNLLGETLVHKQCRRCKVRKPIADFYLVTPGPKTRRKPYRESRCNKCMVELRKEWMVRNPEQHRGCWLKFRYGITIAEYEAMSAAQGHLCACCGAHADSLPIDKRTGKKYRFAVDHCHGSGKVRALLCKSCNTGLGCFGDDPRVVHAALEYLKKHGKPL